MKQYRVALSLVALILVSGAAMAQDHKGWLGKKFRPQECLEIKAGEFEVKRKLCRIRYCIRQKKTNYEIKGTLDFNKKFVPRHPKRVELELLLIDNGYVCRKQINIDKKVTLTPFSFSMITVKNPDQMYIRTYYTLYYQ